MIYVRDNDYVKYSPDAWLQKVIKSIGLIRFGVCKIAQLRRRVMNSKSNTPSSAADNRTGTKN
jgi:hypothetical protein